MPLLFNVDFSLLFFSLSSCCMRTSWSESPPQSDDISSSLSIIEFLQQYLDDLPQHFRPQFYPVGLFLLPGMLNACQEQGCIRLDFPKLRLCGIDTELVLVVVISFW